MSSAIAIVGTGPTGLYAFAALIEKSAASAITLFEKGEEAGVGMPYSPDSASATMLANIASIEIPPITQTYLAFLLSLSDATLAEFKLKREELDERSFTPRLLMGRYFRAEFLALVQKAEAAGITVQAHENTEIIDLERTDGLFELVSTGGQRHGLFDRVILATGHSFDSADESTSYFPNPWSGLISADIPACRIGIMGTSLSSIDAAMAVVTQHGRFSRQGEDLRYTLDDASAQLSVTLMSRQGILPEADFYCPIPYEPLNRMTDKALHRIAAEDNVLDAAFALMVEELWADDPAYAQAIGLQNLTADSFAHAYFARRLSEDPFRWARKNLAEVERNKREKRTVPWRYALLRMHEKIETLVPEFSDADRERFDAGLKRVFVDNYAAVPSESIRRLLALRDAGILQVIGLGNDYTLERVDKLTRIRKGDETLEFDVFIDARGQKPLETAALPFPTLRKELLAVGHEVPEVGDDYSIGGNIKDHRRLYLASIPYLMHDHPFVQGIVMSHEIGTLIATSCAEANPEGRRYRARSILAYLD